ncbi:Ras-related protein Rab-18 [Pseudohyphozyma bogoriensis]|nr:Ras-related protein Rab-18 [Pseudohyphozyma bogoriensis]
MSAQASTSYSSSAPPTVLKLLIIGASSVGKSSLLLRFTDELFLSPDETSATIGVDFKVKVVERQGKKWKLSIWVRRAGPLPTDTAGQERFRTLTSSYYRGAQGVILVYDITQRDTFDSLASWIAELDTFAGQGQGAKDVVRMIVANKTDKEFSRTVSAAEGAAFAASRNPPWGFMEASAKRGGDEVNGEDGIFTKLLDQIIDTPSLYTKPAPSVGSVGGRAPGGYPRPGTVTLDEEMEGDSSWCAYLDAFLHSIYPPSFFSRPSSSSHNTRPFVTLTYAQSLDGKIAGPGGTQIRLSGDESMLLTHKEQVEGADTKRLSLASLLTHPDLGDSLMVEGGASIISSFLTSKLVDLVIITIAPVLVGEGVGMVSPGVSSLFFA